VEGYARNPVAAGNSTSGTASRLGVHRESSDSAGTTCFKAPDKKRPVLILTRDSAVGRIASSPLRQLPLRSVGSPRKSFFDGGRRVPNTCAANFDNSRRLPKSNIGGRIARLRRGE